MRSALKAAMSEGVGWGESPENIHGQERIKGGGLGCSE